MTPHHLTFNAVRGYQFGKEVISMKCTAEQILKFIEIDRDVQRDVIEQHVTDIKKYINYGLDGNDIYFRGYEVEFKTSIDVPNCKL